MIALSYPPNTYLPTAEDLPCSDQKPVDHELQINIPFNLFDIFARLFADRDDWLFAVNMGIYYHPNQPPLVPDAFICLGVSRAKVRPSYVLWEENYIIPLLVLEVVSKTYNGEYDTKMSDYAELGVLYYVVYNPLANRSKPGRSGRPPKYGYHKAFELYKFERGEYVLQTGNPIWLPELGIGIGNEVGERQGQIREWLYWYNRQGQRHLSSYEAELQAEWQVQKVLEMAMQEHLRAESERLRAEDERLRAEEARQQVEAERLRAEDERLRAEEALQQAEAERLRADRLEAYLKSIGVNLNL